MPLHPLVSLLPSAVTVGDFSLFLVVNPSPDSRRYEKHTHTRIYTYIYIYTSIYIYSYNYSCVSNKNKNSTRQLRNMVYFKKLSYLVMQSTSSKFHALWHSSGVFLFFTLARRYFFFLYMVV